MAYLENSKSDSKSCLNRPYSTIGIEGVFVDPPPTSFLPQSYLTSTASGDASFQTWEIIGSIKSAPEDFVVREIASRKRTPKIPFNDFDLVADLSEGASSESTSTVNTFAAIKEAVDQAKSSKEVFTQEFDGKTDEKLKIGADQVCDEATDSSNLSPAEIIEQILSNAFGNEKTTAILDQLQILQQRAVSYINEYPNAPVDANVWIPPLSSSHDSVDNKPHGGGTRGTLHQSLRMVFPLLKSETVLRESTLHPSHANDSGYGIQSKHPWIQVSIDDLFFGLVPSLYRPEHDIPQLYSFRNRGCNPSANQQIKNENGRGKKRKRKETDDNASVVLRLRPDLTREGRRPVHHLISTACRDFETSTIPNYCTTDECGDIAAIVVRWSNRAQQRALKKKAITGSHKSSNAPETATNSLFVLKKTKKEHLAVIQRLARALRCRQSDIGFAGIKDMHAVTYQFCTVANTSPQRIKRAKSSLLSQGIELGRIHQVDWILNKGDLQGNRFEIVVRNVKRIQVTRTNGECSEVIVPCTIDHIRAMVRRVDKSGFVNFFGEQRLGMPGSMSQVGVRSFDIGRALLQQDFSKAIDLLMTGRLLCRGENEVESAEIRHARQVWSETNGDASETLKAIPRGDAMARERNVLQGLKRYGRNDPLAALKCLHFAVRTFWISAYQSYVWNSMASARLKRFGTNVVKGDLYRLNDDGSGGVQVVTDESTSIKIEDVVLPLPGYAITYPENEIGALYHDFLKEENVSFGRNSPDEVTAKGSYRSLIANAQNLSITFDECDKDSSIASQFVLKFDLPSGSYATMLLRELMTTTVDRSEYTLLK